jgi:DNA invertase Pin-like site-specific DNA recombinase
MTHLQSELPRARTPRGIIYTRVSTLDQVVEGHSLEHQELVLRQLCMHGLGESPVEILEVFVEPGISGKTIEQRPALKNAIAFARENLGAGDFFLVFEVSRIARNAQEAIWLLNTLSSLGITLRDANKSYDFNAVNRLQFGIQAVFAEYDNNLKGEQTRDRMRALAESGRWLHKTPYGFLRGNRSEPSLLVHPEEAEDVLRIFEAALNGRMPSEIARIVSLSEPWLRRYGDSSEHANLKRVLRILGDKKYIGVMESSLLGEPVVGDWEPIIPHNLFNEVQQVLTHGVHIKHGAKLDRYPLKKALSCGECGGGFTAFMTKKGRYGYYQCMKCRRVRISLEKAHEQFYELLVNAEVPLVLLPQLRASILEKATAEVAASKKHAVEIERAIKASEADYQRLLVMSSEAGIEPFKRSQIEKMMARKEAVITKLQSEFQAISRLDTSFVDEALTLGEELLTQPARTWTLLDDYSRASFALALYPCRVKCSAGRLKTDTSLAMSSKLEHSSDGKSFWHPQRDSNPCRHLERVVS